MHWSNTPPWSGSYLLVLFFNLILIFKLLLKYIVDFVLVSSIKQSDSITHIYVYIHTYICIIFIYFLGHIMWHAGP